MPLFLFSPSKDQPKAVHILCGRIVFVVVFDHNVHDKRKHPVMRVTKENHEANMNND